MTFDSEKNKLVHVSTYATMAQPGSYRSKKKQVFTLHFGCGRRRPRGEFTVLGERSKRVPTCLGCVRWAYRSE